MTLTTREKYLLALLAVAIAFAGGRYSNRSVEQTTVVDTKKNQDVETHTTQTETTTKKPDGTTTTVTHIDTTISDKTKIDDTSKTQISPKASILNVSALVSPGFQDGLKIAYGISVTKEILGPVTVGAFGLTNGTVGISIGLDF